MAESGAPLILVVVAGSNPRTVADALAAAIASEHRPVDEIHVMAPAATGDSLRTRLLRSPSGRDVLSETCVALGMNRTDITFSARTIHLLGSRVETAEIGAMADDALAVLTRLCSERSELRIVASVDSGPLPVLIHAALQLVGRPDDRFFFLQDVRAAHKNKGSQLPALLEVTTVLAERPSTSRETFQRLAAERRVARRRLMEPDVLVVDASRRTIRTGETEIPLPRLQFFWLFTLATLTPQAFPLKRLTGNFDVDTRGRIVVSPDAPERVSLESLIAHVSAGFTTLFPESTEEFPLIFKRACGPSPGLPSIVAKINARIRRALGTGADPYLIGAARGGEGYRMMLPAERIRTEGRVASTPSRKQYA